MAPAPSRGTETLSASVTIVCLVSSSTLVTSLEPIPLALGVDSRVPPSALQARISTFWFPGSVPRGALCVDLWTDGLVGDCPKTNCLQLIRRTAARRPLSKKKERAATVCDGDITVRFPACHTVTRSFSLFPAPSLLSAFFVLSILLSCICSRLLHTLSGARPRPITNFPTQVLLRQPIRYITPLIETSRLRTKSVRNLYHPRLDILRVLCTVYVGSLFPDLSFTKPDRHHLGLFF